MNMALVQRMRAQCDLFTHPFEECQQTHRGACSYDECAKGAEERMQFKATALCNTTLGSPRHLKESGEVDAVARQINLPMTRAATDKECVHRLQGKDVCGPCDC